MEQPSEILLTAAAGGDRVALETLLQRHLPGVRSFLRTRMGAAIRSHESSVDLVQSVCREVLAHANRFEHGGEDGFRRWLYCTAERKIADRADYYRAAKRRGTTALPDSDDAALAAGRMGLSPSRQASAREELSRVQAALERMSDEQRDVIVSARMLGLSHAEIAARLGKTEGAVRTMLFRAMARLTEMLGESGTGE